MSNVRFYRLDVLPGFDNSKHVGIFVHVTVGDTTHKAGLWFGGKNGWEYLTNDTTPESITNAINALDVPGYAQATITTATDIANSSILTIKGIQEVDGKIGIPTDSENFDLDIAIDGVYNSTNKIATQSTVADAINTLNVETIQAVTFNTSAVDGNTTLTFNGVKEENGVIAQGDEQTPSTFIVGDAKLKIQIGSTTTDVFSANAQSDSTIQLDGNVFKKGENDVISVITPTAVSDKNRLVTEKDVASLAGAMHYKGTVSSLADFEKIINNADSDSDAEEAGNVYIATGNFTHGENVISTGDMIVFNDANTYNVIQSNITLGTGAGQVAANDGNLTAGNIVVATDKGIKTIGISETNLTDTTTNNKRDLTTGSTDVDANVAGLYHSATITDTFKVIGKDFSKKIKISSTNRSIEIKSGVNSDDGNETGVVVDLVWNTSMDPNN